MKDLHLTILTGRAGRHVATSTPLQGIKLGVIRLCHPHFRLLQGATRSKYSVLLGILIILMAPVTCAVIPSPLIVGNTYTNFEYEFSMDLPYGWFPADDPEAVLERNARWLDDDMISLVLVHPESQAVLAVLNQKQELPFPRYIDLDVPYWEERIDAMRERLEAEVGVQRYDYQIYKDNLVATQQHYFLSQRDYKPEKVFGVDALIIENQVPKQLIFEWFLFPCQKDRSCQTIVMMTCRQERFEEDKPAFDFIVTTLRAHDYYN
jgi:hypothetical protein